MVLAYPWVLFALAGALELWLGSPTSLAFTPPSTQGLVGVSMAGVLVLVAHSWMMTTTELTRLHHSIATTREEQQSGSVIADQASPEAREDLGRQHSAHRNLTENCASIILLVFPFLCTSPGDISALIWPLGFGIARFGHAWAYLHKNTGARGLFMSLSLLSQYAMAVHLLRNTIYTIVWG